jgi:photosystem II stability/assembly factor-like uncharacterized protein
MLADGRVVMISANGQVLISDDAGASFSSVAFDPPSPLSGVIEASSNELILVGLAGLRSLSLAASSQ